MLRIIQSTSSVGAKTYYTAGYYTESQERAGVWQGLGAARLGLAGIIKQEDWERLCDNRHPVTGKLLTQRRKHLRRVGYDFNFHVPKSVSVLYAMTGEERLVQACRDSVQETMQDIEQEMKTRVRKNGKNEDRLSPNMVWGEFVHFTARPVNGVPDPHLHIHAFVQNLVFDEKENRWKAGQFGDIKRDAKFFEAKFHSRMARRMAELGLPVERTRTGWEIAGISKGCLDKFSRRTTLIEAKAKELEMTSAKKKAELGGTTREAKQKDLTLPELRKEWQSRLSVTQSESLANIATRLGQTAIPENHASAPRAAALAIEHCFQSKSVVAERRIIAEALKRSYGEASVTSVLDAVQRQPLIVKEHDGQIMATSLEVLAQEESIIAFARNGRGTCRQFANGEHVFREQRLNDGQRKAVRHVLESRDRVILIRGSAGTGKTTMVREAVAAIEATGTKVYTFAPSAAASYDVLRKEGFEDAQTVAMLLSDPRLQAQARGQCLWIDEASLLGAASVAKIFELAEQVDARVVLAGDRTQHSSIDRGAVLRALETQAGLVSAQIKDIQRQSGQYKQAVQALSDGQIDEGFNQLDTLGWIREESESDRYQALAKEYLAAMKQGYSTLVISPTHRESGKVTHEIRTQLREAKILGAEDREVTAIENRHLTVAERRDAVNYAPGDVIVFHQNAVGYRKGQRLVVGERALPLDQAERFSVFKPKTLSLTSGDLVRITHNGKTRDGHRLNNGAIVEVKGFTAGGDIKLTNGSVLAKDWGHLDHGFCTTTYASQGRTVDVALVAQSAESFGASSREGFYVSASRARKMTVIFTDDKQSLLEAVRQSGDRLTAMEFMAGVEHRGRETSMEREQRERDVAGNVARRQMEEKGISYER